MSYANTDVRCALVTGSTSGIGLAIAEALARAGWRVALHGLGTPGEVAHALGRVDVLGVNRTSRHFHADLRNPATARNLVAEAEAWLGRLDLLVNNAGIQFTSRVEDFPAEKWDEILATNLSAVFHACAAAIPGMQARDRGRIVNIASIHGLVASREKAAYVAAKHGVVGLTKTIALENAQSGLTCNAICPGWVKTPLVEVQIRKFMDREGVGYEQAVAGLLREKEPSQRFTTPEQVASAVLFLAGDAADNITGINLAMDGGWTAQ